MKDGKELKPVSMRVRDAAEALLTIVLEHVSRTVDHFLKNFLGATNVL